MTTIETVPQQMQDKNFYVTGGTLTRDAPCYVARKADQELFDGLMLGQFCYVLTSRQMGKSSLMVRTAARLREAGVSVVVLDLTAIGQNLTTEQWYDGLLGRIGRQLHLEDELEEFWFDHQRQGPLERLMNALYQVVLPRHSGRIVIFVDEIDAVRSLPFSTDEFFAAIRECYNRRTEDAELERLTFCLLGVATPSDLIRDTRTTPFNIGRRIELNDFSEDEAAPLKQGLRREGKSAAKLLKRILYWTGGHPYLTQRLCLAAAQDGSVKDAGGVDRLCEELFFSARARERDDNLLFVRERMLKSEADLAALLDLYKKIRDHKRVKDDEANPLVSVLRLSGIARVVEGLLYVRNRIYYRVFDREWVLANMPDAEVQRQRAAYRRGLWRAATIAAVILAIVGSLAFVAFRQRNQVKQQAQTNRRLLYATQMNLIQQDWESAKMRRFDQLMAQQIPQPGEEDLRGFEWYYFWQLRQSGRERASFAVSKGQLVGDLLSPDGQLLAQGFNDGTVKLWDVAAGKEIKTFSAHKGRMFEVVFSPDSRTFATYSQEQDDRTVKLWDVATGQATTIYDGQAPTVRMSPWTFSPDGKTLAMTRVTNTNGNYDAAVVLWDVDAQKAVATFKGSVWGIAFSPNGRTLVTSGGNTIRFWDIATRRELAALKQSDSTTQIVFSPDGRRLAIGTGSGAVKLWDATTRQEIGTLKGHTGEVFNLVFSRDGRQLASSSRDATVKLWNVAAQQELNTYKGHTAAVYSIAFWPDGKTLASSGADHMVRLWDVAPRQNPTSFPDPTCPGCQLRRFALSPDGKTLAFVKIKNQQNVFRLWDAATGQELAALKGDSTRIFGIAFSPDGKTVAAAGYTDKTAKLWDVASQREIITLNHTKHVGHVAFSPDGKMLASYSVERPDPFGLDRQNCAVTLWEVATGRELATITLSVEAGPMVFSPNGKLLATGHGNGVVKLWDVATRRELAELKGHDVVIRSLAFSPDGKLLAAGSWDGTVQLWDVTTGRSLTTLQVHSIWVDSVAFSPDGKTLASSDANGLMKLWNVATWVEMVSYKQPKGAQTSVAFSADGKTLAVNGDNIELWHAATEQEVLARRGQ